MKIQNLNINNVKPYEKNAKKHPKEQVDNICESLKQFGWQQPIVVDKDNVIIVGHGRYFASLKLGYDTVPCVVADNLTPEQVKKYRLLDNKLNESEWDYELLKNEIWGVEQLTFDGFNVDWGIPQEEDEIEIVEVDVPDIPENPITQRGDVWILGEHRLMCGDSTNSGDVEKLMNGEVADLLYTDPPYNVNLSNSEGMTIENDNMPEAQFEAFIDDAMRCASENLKKGGAFYVWHADTRSVIFRNACTDNGLMVKQCLIWVKNGFTFGRQDYKWKHEPCLYGWKEGAGHYFAEEYNHPTVIEDNLDIDKMKKEQLKQVLREILTNHTPTTIIYADKPIKNDLHPTMKPIRVCADMIRLSSKKQELVLDLFGGSGSTLIACEQLNRKCYMMEYEPKYADVIVKRWEELTGKTAVREKN